MKNNTKLLITLLSTTGLLLLGLILGLTSIQQELLNLPIYFTLWLLPPVGGLLVYRALEQKFPVTKTIASELESLKRSRLVGGSVVYDIHHQPIAEPDHDLEIVVVPEVTNIEGRVMMLAWVFQIEKFCLVDVKFIE